MNTHYARWRHPEQWESTLLYQTPPTSLCWAPLYQMPMNYMKQFADEGFTATDEQTYMLVSFAQQEVRALEQALTSHIMPVFYKGHPVSTSHNNWQPGMTLYTTEGNKTTWVCVDGTGQGGETFGSAESMALAAKELGVSHATIKKYANSPLMLTTNQWGTVNLTVLNLPTYSTVESMPHMNKTKLPNPYDTSSLEPGRVHAVTVDGILQKQTFGSPAEAARELGLKVAPVSARTYVNKLHPLFSNVLGVMVYLVGLNLFSPKAIKVVVSPVEPGTGTPVTFNSISEARRKLGESRDSFQGKLASGDFFYTRLNGKNTEPVACTVKYADKPLFINIRLSPLIPFCLPTFYPGWFAGKRAHIWGRT